MRYLIICFFLSCSSIFAGEPDIPLHQECLYPTILLESKDAGRMGSGVIIKSIYHEKSKHWLNTILSSAHIIDGQSKNPKSPYIAKIAKYQKWSVFTKYESFSIHIRRIDYSKDICVLNFWSKEKMFCAKVDLKSNLYIGNDIMRSGCGLGDEMRIDYGKVTSINTNGKLRTSIFCLPGDSGGPVYHNNKLIGVVQAIQYMNTDEKVRVPVPHISYIIPLSYFNADDLSGNYP